MARDNISGIRRGLFRTIILFPGMAIQWFMYMGVGNVKGYGKVRSQTRLARSPFMTWIYSIMFWVALVWFFLSIDSELY